MTFNMAIAFIVTVAVASGIAGYFLTRKRG